MADPLDTTQFLQGTFSLIYVIISFTIGVIIISKYFKFKNSTFLLVGIAWTGMSFPWMGDVINFLLYLFSQPFLTEEAYLFLINAFLPFFVILWVIALTKLLQTKHRNLAIIFTVVAMLIFEVLFFVFFIVDFHYYIGESVTPFQYNFGVFIDIFFLAMIALILITGIKFAWVSLKSGEKEIALKGKLLILAFITFTVAALLDSQIELNPVTVVIVRVILIISSFAFYMGFILPDWAKKMFKIG